MASHLIGQNQITTFTSPVNGTAPINADTVRNQDNVIKTSYNTHDADPTIHVQDSILGSRATAGTAGRKWLTTDASAFYLFYDDGSSWNEISYLRSSGGTITGAVTITSSSANALAVGPNGTTNPTFNIDASTASAATGIQVKGAAAGADARITVLSSALAENLTIDAKGTGTITLNGTATGAIVLTRATTISAALTYGGVTLSNAVTGTGNMVLSAGPTLTGTVAGANATWSGTLGVTGVATFTAQPILSSLTASQAVFTDGSKGLVSNAITGSGNVVMSASPTLTGTIVLTGATITGTPTWSSSQAITLSTAAQPNVTSVGTLTSASISTTTGTLLQTRQTSVGTANLNSFYIGNDGSATAAELSLFSTTYTTNAYQVANGLTLINNVGGVVIGAVAGSQTVRIVAGGLTDVATFSSTGLAMNSLALSGITTLATSSTINSQTISSAASFTGTVAVATNLTVTGKTKSNSVTTASTASNTFVTLFSVSSLTDNMFIVYANCGTNKAGAYCLVGVDAQSGAALILAQADGAGDAVITFQLSGANVQAKQVSGSSQTINAWWLRLG